MKRIILAVFCCFVAFAAGRLSAPVGMLEMGAGARLEGPFVMTDACLTSNEGGIYIGPGRFERGNCRTTAWDYVAAVIGRWS